MLLHLELVQKILQLRLGPIPETALWLRTADLIPAHTRVARGIEAGRLRKGFHTGIYACLWSRALCVPGRPIADDIGTCAVPQTRSDGFGYVRDTARHGIGGVRHGFRSISRQRSDDRSPTEFFGRGLRGRGGSRRRFSLYIGTPDAVNEATDRTRVAWIFGAWLAVGIVFGSGTRPSLWGLPCAKCIVPPRTSGGARV